MKPLKLLAIAAVAVALAPAFAMAATLDGGTSGGAVYPVPAVKVGDTGSVNVGAGVTVGATDNTGTDASGSGTTGAGSTTNGMLMITQQDVASGSAGAAGSAAITSSANVSTDADFASFVQSTMQADSNIKEVDADTSSVAVKYAVPGRFLGIFPVMMDASAKVAADGSVTFSYPWYSFLTSNSSNDAAVRTALSAQAASMLSTRPSQASEGATTTAAANSAFSAAEKARILDGMSLVLSNN